MKTGKTPQQPAVSFLVRPVEDSDVDGIIAIDAKVAGGESKPEYWQRKLAQITAGANGHLGLIAERNGKILGFMLGEVRSWEFRQPPTGWITALGTDPAHRREGVARRLIAEMIDIFRSRGLENVRTMVEWADGEVLSFFTAMGFDRGPFIELEKKLNL
ncbi:MAG TPA: GNAT family N-acetyltransferase [Acidobacteriota bacterium]|nr:GNAT family N-acetyltransferase [Acidobacteriota bacterium]